MKSKFLVDVSALIVGNLGNINHTNIYLGRHEGKEEPPTERVILRTFSVEVLILQFTKFYQNKLVILDVIIVCVQVTVDSHVLSTSFVD